MNRRMVWIDGDDLTGWCCSGCQWNVTAPRFDSTVAVLAFNRVAQESFEQHICTVEELQTHAVAGAIPPNETAGLDGRSQLPQRRVGEAVVP